MKSNPHKKLLHAMLTELCPPHAARSSISTPSLHCMVMTALAYLSSWQPHPMVKTTESLHSRQVPPSPQLSVDCDKIRVNKIAKKTFTEFVYLYQLSLDAGMILRLLTLKKKSLARAQPLSKLWFAYKYPR